MTSQALDPSPITNCHTFSDPRNAVKKQKGLSRENNFFNLLRNLKTWFLKSNFATLAY